MRRARRPLRASRTRRGVSTAACALGFAGRVWAQPGKQVRFIVPFPAVRKACVEERGLDPHHFYSDVFVPGPAMPSP